MAADNAQPVQAVLEAQLKGSNVRDLVELGSTDAADSSLAGWKRASVTFTIPADAEEESDDDAGESTPSNAAGMYRLRFHAPDSESPVLVDSIQITQGQSLLPYTLNQGIEANIISPATQGIYQLDAPSDMYFNLAKDQDVTVQKITREVTDYFDRVIVAPADLKISHSGQQLMKLPTDRAGIFRVRSQITFIKAGESHTLTREFFYNVVYPSAPRTDRLAWSQLGGYFTNAPKGPFSYTEVANHFGIYEFNTLGHQMGRWKANMARDPKDRTKMLRQQYDFSASEKELQQFANNKINTFVNFHVNGTSGSYGVPFGLNPESGPVFEFKKNTRFAQEDWLHFVNAYVTHFKGRIKRYEVQDEPYQYFTSDHYAAFYLATYKVIKKADPDAMVFIHNAHGKMEHIDSLNKLTDGKAHQYMDGVYLYLTQQHSGKISRTAVPEFRVWAKVHNLPIFTATCFSAGKDFSKHSLATSPDYLPEREDEVRSVQHFFDSLIWGQAQAFYYYYGSHPGGSYASLFDNFGQIFPMVHFYSAANALVGDHTNIVSVDTFDPLRIGVVETQRNKTYAILYSVDGKLHTLTTKADAFVQALDGFGNPMVLDKTNGQMHLVVGPQPVYLIVNNATEATAALQAGSLKELFDIEFTYQRPVDGGLELRALITSAKPLKAWTDTYNVYRRDEIETTYTKQLADQLYELRIPLSVSPVNTLNNSYYLKMSSNLGDLYASYENTYAPLLEGTPVVDGKYSAGEWPIHESQTLPLGGYYTGKDSNENKAYTRGQMALTYDANNLYGLVTLYKSQSGHTVTLEIAKRDSRTGLVQEDQITRIVVSSKSINVNGVESTGTQVSGGSIKVAADAKRLQATDLIEFSIPLSALSGMSLSDGMTYALRIRANDPPLSEAGKANAPAWYLDASWPASTDVNVTDAPSRWGTLMVVR